MADRWKIVPTTRRTSKPDMVDILRSDGSFVAGYVHRADALRMVHDPAEIADDAIGMFLEYRDRHGHDEEAARPAAVAEIMEGCVVDVDALNREEQEYRAFRAANPLIGDRPEDVETFKDLPF